MRPISGLSGATAYESEFPTLAALRDELGDGRRLLLAIPGQSLVVADNLALMLSSSPRPMRLAPA